MTSIGYAAFSRCSSLTSITCEALIPPTCSSLFFSHIIVAPKRRQVIGIQTVEPYITEEGEYNVEGARREGFYPGGDIITEEGESEYNITLYVPCQSLDAYKAHEEFGKFTNIQCIQGAKPVTVTLSSDCNKKGHKYDLRSGQVVDLSQPGGNISSGDDPLRPDDPSGDFETPTRKTTNKK